MVLISALFYIFVILCKIADNYGVNTNGFENYTTRFIIVFGIVFALIFSKIYDFGHKKAVKMFGEKFPKEKIMHVAYENKIAINLITFAVGGFGTMIFLSLFFDMSEIGKINKFNVWFYALIFLISAVFNFKIYNDLCNFKQENTLCLSF